MRSRCAAAILLSLACGQEQPGSLGHDAVPARRLAQALGAEERIVLSIPSPDPNRTRPLRINLAARPFQGALETTRPVRAEREDVLEFSIWTEATAARDCSMVLAALGREDRELWRGPPVLLRHPGARQLSRLLRVVRVDLSSVSGRPVTLRWRMEGPCAAKRGLLARARVRPARAEPLPPVLLICSDQHRWDYALGPLGAERMPQLAEWARNAVVYANTLAPASWTLPSIVSTLTGLHARYHRTGVRIESGPIEDWDERELPPGQFFASWAGGYHIFTAYPTRLWTLAQRLQPAGYTTAAVITNPFYTESGLLQEGFDLKLAASGERGASVNRVLQSLLTRHAGTSPLFLLVHYMDVHQYRSWAPSELKERGFSDAELREAYARRVAEADAHLGELLRLWDRAVGMERSVVAFYSDHGEHLREPGRPTQRHGDSMDEVVLRVPLVVSYPAALGRRPGVDSRPASLVDLVPTVLDAIGLEAEPGAPLHGLSLLAEPPAGSRALFADHQLEGDELSALHRGGLKLLVNWSSSERLLLRPGAFPTRVPEAQWRVDDPAAHAELEESFDAYVTEAGAFSSGLSSDVEVDADTLQEQLRELGYVE